YTLVRIAGAVCARSPFGAGSAFAGRAGSAFFTFFTGGAGRSLCSGFAFFAFFTGRAGWAGWAFGRARQAGGAGPAAATSRTEAVVEVLEDEFELRPDAFELNEAFTALVDARRAFPQLEEERDDRFGRRRDARFESLEALMFGQVCFM